MKKTYLMLSLVPTTTLSTALVVEKIVDVSKYNELNYIIDNDVVENIKKNIKKDLNSFRVFDDGSLDSLYGNINQSLIKGLEKIMNTKDLFVEYYYGDYNIYKQDNVKIDFKNENDEEVALWFSVVIRSNNPKYSGYKIINFDFRPKISELGDIYMQNKYGRDIDQVMKGLQDTFGSIAFKTNLKNYFDKIGFSYIGWDFNEFNFNKNDINEIINSGIYNRETDYDEANKNINFRTDLLSPLKLKRKTSMINFDKDFNIGITGFKFLTSNILKNDMDLEGKEIPLTLKINNTTSIGDIRGEVGQYLIDKIFNYYGLQQEENIKIEVVFKKDYKKETIAYDEEEKIKDIYAQGGKYFPWVEIWSISDTRFRINNEIYKDGPGFRAVLGDVIDV